MDRFIAVSSKPAENEIDNLKSSMDRFIENRHNGESAFK